LTFVLQLSTEKVALGTVKHRTNNMRFWPYKVQNILWSRVYCLNIACIF